jgi:ABC-type polysaccharide/polyol phosphate transport system ATPase subunit
MSTSSPSSPVRPASSAARDDIAIDVAAVSKRFKLYHSLATGPLKELLFFWKRERYYREFLAVDDLTLQVRRGEVVGIIGPNGAGKTTLLKMIAGLLPVEKGAIRVNGRVTALLALGVGVHPEFTGRENIYYGGLLLGMSKQEVLAKTPSIIEFAELGEFIDRPFRTYSSGMRARLLFSISMSIDPDILIVDEALATGDAYFVQKCAARIQQLCQSGATVLLVSHNVAQISQLCSRAVFMAGGRIVDQGEPGKVLAAYSQWVFSKEQSAPLVTGERRLELSSGTGEITVGDVRLKNADGEEKTGFFTGESMQVEIHYRSALPSGSRVDLFVGFLAAGDQRYLGEFNTVNYLEGTGRAVNETRLELGPAGVVMLTFDSLLLLNNHCSLWIIFYDKATRYYCEYKNVAPFFVARRSNSWMRGDAVFWQPCRIATRPAP